MLFDLRGKGRRNTVRVIYASLAILMGGGLVLFGIGGDVSGGLLNAFDSGSQDVDTTFNEREEKLEQRVQANPRDAGAFAELARVRFQQASVGENFDQATGTYSESGLAKLRESAQAFDRHLELAGNSPNADVANVMVQAFGPAGLNELERAVNAMEIVVEERPEATGLYAQLAQLAYLAGQTRKGDLASQKAVELAPENQKKQIRQQLESLKTQAAAQAAQDATAAPPPATTTP